MKQESRKAEYSIILRDILRADYIEEATARLDAASPARVNEFISYYRKCQHNICCMHLDTIKKELVFYGIVEQKEADLFGTCGI
jgi:hypothetical protein